MLLSEFHAIEAFGKKCSVFAEFLKKKVNQKNLLFKWWPIYVFSYYLFINWVLVISTLYSLIFCLFKVVYGIVFGLTSDIEIILFSIRQLKNRRATPNKEEIKDETKYFLGVYPVLRIQIWFQVDPYLQYIIGSPGSGSVYYIRIWIGIQHL